MAARARDALQGDNDGNTFTLTGNGAGTLADKIGGTFTGIENLSGGDDTDTFTIHANHSGRLDGGGGGDVFNIANRLMGNVEGGTGDDEFIFSGAGEITGTLAGGTGTDTLNFLALTDAQRQSLRLTDAATGTGLASFINGGGAAGFNGIETLEGFLMRFAGDANRHARWTLASAGNSYQALTAPASDPGARPVGALISLAADINTLAGGDLTDTFDISTAFAGTLQGGAGNDVFTFEDGGSIAGAASGGAGTDHLDYSARTAPIRVTLTASDATGFAGGPVVATRTQTTLTGGFTGIDRLTGGTGTDSLTGHNAAATWTLGTAGNSYAVGNQSLVFSNFDNLTGGIMADSFTLSADHTGNIDTGAGNDSITLAGSARITGDINLGEGDDSLSFASADVRFMGLADGGAGTDTLNGLDLFTRAMPTTLFRYTNFEIVNGEAELLANLPVIRMQETETTAAMRTLISYVDRPPEGRMPDPDSMGGGQPPAPVPAMPDMGTDTDSTDRMGAGIDTDMGGDGTDMGGMDGGNMAGTGTDTDSTDRMGAGIDTDMGGDGTDMGGMDGGDMAGMGTDTDTPTPPTAPVTPTRETQMAERIAALSRDYGGEVTPLNAAGDGLQDVNAYLFVDPTGPAAQAASVEALSTRINQILNQRLSGGLKGSGHALRPQPLAAEATGGGDGPLLWGEIFAAERRRGQDGLTLSHVHDYQGLVFGAEQVDPSGQQRLGVLFGYADADIRTDLRSLELDTGSLFGGVYGRFSRQALAINLGLNLGYESHDNRRYIPQLQQVAEADYRSIFVNPWLSLSRAWPLREGLELRPALMLNYSVARYDGYEERGGQGFALAVAGRTAHNLSTRLQLAGVRTEPDTGHELGLRLGVEGRLAGGGHFEGRLGGSSFDYSDAEDRSAQAVFIGLDGRHALSEALTLQLDVEYSHHIGGVSERSLGGFVRLVYAY